ncbi:MAG TPA: DNA polymerase III subunit delta, partial [Cryptosporangiaceae bacterium]|nr:DNA polymerase III subunit delta [Cryptosporangiaceae bacterium]
MPGPVPPLQLVVGDDEFLASRAVAEIVAAARSVDPACDVREVDAGQLTPGELPELVSPSLFAETRVIVLRAGQDAGKDLTAAVLRYAADPGDGIVLVVTHLGGARGKPLLSGLREAGAQTVPAARITKHRDRLAFVRDEIARHGGRVTPEAAALILDAVGNDLRELASVCGQLVADTGGRIDAAAVGRYHRGRAEVTGFTVADASMVGDTAAALEALRWALAVGVDPVPIADALADGVRTVARVAGAGRGSPYQLAGTLGLPPWKVERAQRQAHGWTGPGLRTAMRAAATVNADVKGGAEDRAYALERAVLGIV